LYSSATGDVSASNHNLIWSDESAVAHTAATSGATATNDWTNSYLLQSVLSSEAYSQD